MQLLNKENYYARQLQHAAAKGRDNDVTWLLEVAGIAPDAKMLTDLCHAHDAGQMAATNGKTSTLMILRNHGYDFFGYTRTGMKLEELSDKHRHAKCSRYIRKVKDEETIKELMEEYSD